MKNRLLISFLAYSHCSGKHLFSLFCLSFPRFQARKHPSIDRCFLLLWFHNRIWYVYLIAVLTNIYICASKPSAEHIIARINPIIMLGAIVMDPYDSEN